MEFLKAIEIFTKGMNHISTGFSKLCPTCLDAHDICCEHKAQSMLDEGLSLDEGNFSTGHCDTCNTYLFGKRYAAHYLDDNNEIVHLEICQDCTLYFANGDVPEYW